MGMALTSCRLNSSRTAYIHDTCNESVGDMKFFREGDVALVSRPRGRSQGSGG